MVRRKHWLITAACTTMAAGLVAAPSQAATPPTSGPSAKPSSTVTLITGDKVTVTPQGKSWTVSVEQARQPGRPEGFFRQVTPAGVTVIPASALPLVRSGVLDRALFDVTGLIDQKLDDAHTKELPLLVQGGNTRAAATFGKVTRQLPAAKLAAVSVAKPFELSKLTGTTKIWLNGRAKPTLDVSVPQVGAPAAWQAGYTGAGVQVAVLDTGYDAAHPDLKGVVKGSKDFLGDGSGMKDEVGHGTHVASTVAGRGTASGGRYVGVAKGADLLIGKVCGVDGCPYDAIIAGMQWAAASGAKVVNLSLGGGPTDGTDPLSAEVNRLTAATGTLFVIAAGNDGPTGRVSSPATADAALAVASVTKQDELSDFSSIGPRVGDYAMKPDLAAPGSDIVAARAAGTLSDEAVDEYYARISGTSMATPHVAGGAAILAGQHPGWKAPQLKAALMGSAHPISAGVFAQGAGRLDLARGTSQQVLAEPASLSFTAASWPHDKPQDQSKQVVYRNDGEAAITLELRLDVRNSAGAEAPAGLFKTSADQVVVPAGGQASVGVSVAPGNVAPETYGGRLVASSADGKTVVQTPLGVYVEPESYDLSLTMKDRTGAPIEPSTGNGTAVVLSLDDRQLQYFPVLPGDKVRLPAGRYAVLGAMNTPVPGRLEPSVTSAAEPEIDLRSDTVVPFDARQGQQISLALDAKDAKVVAGTAGTVVHTDKVDAGFISTLVRDSYAVPTRGSVEHFGYYTRAQLERPLVRLTAEGKDTGATWAPNTAQLVGAENLTVVDAGHARPEDVAGKDLKGKLALFTLSGDEGSAFDERVGLLQQAGATAALFYFKDEVGVSTDETRLPTLVLDDASAGRLAGQQVRLAGNAGSPYRYEIALPSFGKIPGSLAYRLPNRSLGAVQAKYHAFAPGGVGYLDHSSIAGTIDMGGYLWSDVVKLPTARTEYYSTGVHWQTSLRAAAGPEESEQAYLGLPHVYKPGEKVSIDWAKPVFGPGFGALSRGERDRPLQAYRDGDSIDVLLPLFSDSASHTGIPRPEEYSFADKGTTSLYADGKVVGQSDIPGDGVFKVPAGEAAYRLVTSVRRDSPRWPLATQVSAEWAFRSSTTDGPEALPLLAVRLDPRLDLLDNAPAGRRFAIPVSVPGGRLKAVEASYDDGATWQAAVLRRVGSGWTATIRHPASGFVSLRSSATDAKGNSVVQTTIRAYRLK
ncbi:S8 family serine peptidase [Kribbella sp. NBC_00382]|uniref:S8 family serine peptidase n=1 Tax=Kribbella sp. NBC_00382 TaxID=2975967 RepID=UPI002E21551A